MTPMKTDRNMWLLILLNMVTCGIYGIIFWYKYAEDVNVVCKQDGKTTMNYFLMLLLTMLTCGIYGFIWQYQVLERVYQAGARYQVNTKMTGGMYLLWTLLGSCIVVGPFIALNGLCEDMNNICAQYNRYGRAL